MHTAHKSSIYHCTHIYTQAYVRQREYTRWMLALVYMMFVKHRSCDRIRVRFAYIYTYTSIFMYNEVVQHNRCGIKLSLGCIDRIGLWVAYIVAFSHRRSADLPIFLALPLYRLAYSIHIYAFTMCIHVHILCCCLSCFFFLLIIF